MLIAGKAMAGALEILRPLLAETGAASIGKVVMGTVKGDVHDIGKNLVQASCSRAPASRVIDLGVQVAPEKFVAAVVEHQRRHPRLLGVPDHDDADVQGQHQRAERAGRRDKVLVMVGGAPVTQEYADVVVPMATPLTRPPPWPKPSS